MSDSPNDQPDEAEEEGIPVTQETMAGSLIDSARITTMAALMMLGEPEPPPLIVAPGERAGRTEPTVHDCLEQALQWLDVARVKTIEAGAPVTSLHVVAGR